jgi:hypothetical protein
MRILIAEEALQGGEGHWPSYIGGIAAGLREAGDQVEVLAHRDCTAELANHLNLVPLFSRNCWIDTKSQGAIGGLRHNAIFHRELFGWIRGKDVEYDWVCALTMRLQHLLAFARLSRDPRIPQKTRFLLLFVQGFGAYTGPDRPVAFPTTASNLLARLCFKLMGPAVRRGKVVLAGETNGMCRELGQFTGLPVACFPHPVPPPAAKQPFQKRDSLTLTCPGFARHEKGTDLLQEAILELLEDKAFAHLHFVLQWPKPFQLPNGVLLGPDSRLVREEKVELLNDTLDGTGYEALLLRSSLVLLPYRRASYHNRVSRVAIEAASREIPLVHMLGTWSDEVAAMTGAGVAIREETGQAVLEAIKEAVRSIDTLREKAVSGAGGVKDYFSVATFRDKLVEGGLT